MASVPAEAQPLSDDNTLRSLRVAWGSDTYSMSPAFDRFRNDYVVVVPADRTEVLVTPTKNHHGATGPHVTPGDNDGTGSYTVALSPGSNIVHISLSAELGHFRRYSLNIYRGGSLPTATLPSGALLNSLRLTADAEVVEFPGAEIEGEDCGCATYYRMVVPKRVSRVGLFATVQSGARVETQFRTGNRRSGATRNVSLREGRNELIVFVYRTGNQGGRALEVYRLLIIRAGSPPKIKEATVTREGNVLLRYDRTLLPDIPGQRRTPGSAFEVTVDGTRVNVTRTAVTQKWLHLTLARAAGPDAQVRVRYRIPSSNPVRSGKYGLAEEFRNKVARYAGSGLLVFDATANEAPGATVDFKVMMLPAPVRRASVDYATSDDTATAGADYTATSGTLIFEVGETHKTISVPVIDDAVPDSGETFTLTLSNPINAFLGDGTATATGTIYNHDPEDLTASFGGVPETHGGEPFVMLLQFTEPVGVGWGTMNDRLLNVTNGRVAQARRVDRKHDPVTDKVLSALWEITIDPSFGDVTVELPATADCEAPLAVCTKDGRPLSAAASVTVALEALTATQSEYPSVHERAELDLEVAFSAPVTLTPEAMRNHALTVANAELVSVSRAADDEKRWRFRVLPLSNETVTVELPAPSDCAAEGAVCTADGRKLASAVRWEIAPRDPDAVDAAGPEPVSAEVERAALVLVYGEGLDEASVPAPEAFTVTVAGAVRSLAASAPVTVSGRRVFLALASTVAPGEAVTVSYAVPPESRLQDRADNDAPAVSDLAVTNATPPFTVRFEEGSVPETHDGVNRVAFRIVFSEDPAKLQGRWVSKLLREAVVARIGGDRIYTRDIERLGDSGRRHWQMKVRFLGGFALATEDLTIELGPTSDCADADALCTQDGWKLSNRISARIRYAPSLSVAGVEATEAAGATVDFPVTLSRAQARPVTVDYATSDGAATAGEDYTAVTGTLTFAPGETKKTVSVAVLDDGEAEEAETLTLTLSNASGAGTVIRTASATGTIEDDEPAGHGAPGEPLTASFSSVPGSHDGAAFTLELRFSEEFSLSYLTLRDHALDVTGGTLAGVARAPKGQNQVWDVTVRPAAGAGDVTVTLAATTDCTATGAICAADARPLSAAVSATVPRTVSTPTPFRVSFSDVPDEHDGTSPIVFKVLFNKKPRREYSYVRIRDATVQARRNAAVVAAQAVERLNRPHNDRWLITVPPGGKEDVTVSVGPFASCSDAGAVCTGDGELLSNAVTRTILGPPGLSVADAQVYEAPDATLDFAVTLARASGSTVSVDYATGDGTASAGSDYTATSGTLIFAPGETAKTVAVPVIGDDVDEGDETLTLTLSNPSGGNAWLADARATGTIENSDAVPRAWLGRFGRTVAEQVLEAVEGRIAASRAPGVEATLAGQALGGASEEERAALEEREAEMRLEALSDWLRSETDEAHAPPGQGVRALTGGELLTGTSFALTGGTADGGFGAVWGHGAVSYFDGREGDLTLEGEVTSALLGADWTRARGTVGLMLGHARGAGEYRGEGEGEIESTLTGLYPYGRYEVSERVALWGVAGYGAGELVLTPEGQVALTADMDLVMGAVGVRGVAVEAGPQGGLELSVESDALAVRTSTEALTGRGGNLAAAHAQVTRLKLGLEATWRGMGSEGGGELVPTLEVGVRHDGGDAEAGFGLDVGGGLSWSHPSSGLSAELRARGLLTHEARGFRDRGIAGSLGWDPRPDSERGFSLTLTQSMGAQASGGVDALLGHPHLGGLAANEYGDELGRRQLEARLGYGFSVFGERFTATPEAGLGLSDSHRELSLGWRLGLVRSGPVSMELGLTGTRREAANDERPAHVLMLRGQLRW